MFHIVLMLDIPEVFGAVVVFVVVDTFAGADITFVCVVGVVFLTEDHPQDIVSFRAPLLQTQ